MGNFVFGTTTVPDGKRGPWTIDTFTITPKDAREYNVGLIMSFSPTDRWIQAGTYRRLHHKTRGVVMSNTPWEVQTNSKAFSMATGNVLINGLGLGMLLEGILTKADVKHVRIIEIDPDVIALTGPHFAKDKRVEIINADAYEYKPAKGEFFDFAWHDIWDRAEPENFPFMAKLGRRYNKHVAAAQDFWMRDKLRQLHYS